MSILKRMMELDTSIRFDGAAVGPVSAAPVGAVLQIGSVGEDVRQLQNEIKRLVACARKRVITEEDCGEGVPQTRALEGKPPAQTGASIKSAVESLERQMIADTLRATKNNDEFFNSMKKG